MGLSHRYEMWWMGRGSAVRACLLVTTAVGLGALLFATATVAVARQGGIPPGMQKVPDHIIEFGLYHRGVESDRFVQAFSYGVGGTQIERSKRERENAGSDWFRMSGSEGVTFFVTGLAARLGGDELYIAGVERDGQSLIQKWVYHPRKHGWRVECELPPGIDALGVPAPVAAPSIGTASGDAWDSPKKADEDLAPAERSTLYKDGAGPFHGMAVDPQGRYLVFFEMASKEIQMLDLTQDPCVVTTLRDASAEGFLSADDIQVADFEGEGRKCFVRGRTTSNPNAKPEYLLGSDTDNDGVFEGWAHYTEAAWEASDYSEHSKWGFFWAL